MRFKFLVLVFCYFFALQANADEASAPAESDKGKTTYEQFCVICHQDGVASAPRFENKDDWKPRLAGKTIDDLVASAEKGLNLMPPQGTCTECSADDLKAAIQYMLPKP